VSKKRVASKSSGNRVARVPKFSDGYSVLNSLAAHLAVLGPDGTIRFTNQAWKRFAQENGNPRLSAVGPGANYLEICARAVSDGAPDAQVILSGIKDVLEGKRSFFSIEYTCGSPTEQRWFTMNVSPLEGTKGDAVISHVDITRLLGQREREVKTLLDNSPDVIVRMDREGRYLYVNAVTTKIAGLPAEAILGKTPREVGIPENLSDLWTRSCRDVFDSGLPQLIEFPFPSPEEETIWEERVVPEFAPDGTVQSVLMIGRNITERKKLEKVREAYSAEIRALAARLLTVAEEERRRVSRELHDQICQQLASVAIDIAELAAHPPPPPKERLRSLRALEARVVKTSEEARHLAYELHPSVLDDLGLVSALRALCREFSAKRSLIVEFTNGALPGSMPREVAACLYRVTQEALQNAAKHSTANHISVALTFGEGTVSLSIEDDGVGFDIQRVKGRGGLGLIGMEERVRLVNGKLSIASQAGRGTRIALTVPLPGGNL
jgi:PAS domain S-box-containing protein